MPITSPQAIGLSERQSLATSLANMAEASVNNQEWMPDVPSPKVLAAATAFTVIDNTTLDFLPNNVAKDTRLANILIQNVGINTVKVCMLGDCATASYNQILNASGAAEDGLGGSLRITAFRGKLSVFSDAGTSIAITISRIGARGALGNNQPYH